MKFYSEVLEKFFDEPETLVEAEEAYQKALDEEVKAVEITISSRKKELAKAIEEASTALDIAYEKYEEAKNKVEELQKEYDAKVDAIMTPVVDEIKKCTKDRADAIKNFNDNFGVYTTSYGGDKAIQEFAKLTGLLDILRVF